MDITRGNLEDISRPASSERVRVGSRVSTASLGEGGNRIIRQNPVSLEALSTDPIQVNTMVFETKSFAESISNEDVQNNHLPIEASQTEVSDEENEDQKLQKAVRKMKRLDKILAQKVSKEKEVKENGRELSQKLWHELQELSVNGGSKDAIENTKLFLALTSSTFQESSDEPDIMPVFGTQISENDYEKHPRHQNITGECNNDSATVSSKVDLEQDKESEVESRQTGDATGKQTLNFVKRNIELVSSGQHMLMTLEEKQRLCELLQDIDDESQDHCSDAATPAQGMTSLCLTFSGLGKGFTPEPSELDQLNQIDARLQILPPHFLSKRSPYPDDNMPQVLEQGLATMASPLGERALQAQREQRGQETRLREIQQQLDAWEHSQPYSAEVPRLAEDQLQSLLLECELTLSRAQSLGTHRSSPQGCSRAASEAEVEGDWSPPLSCTPRLSSAALSELLREFKVTSAPETPVDTARSTETEKEK